MTDPNHMAGGVNPPKLAELFARFLDRRAADQAAGLARVEAGAEIMPFEAAPVQTVDARLAWTEGLTALKLYRPGTDTSALEVPPEWATLIANQDPALGLALCTGNYPQAVRNLHPLLQTAAPKALAPVGTRPVSAPALIDWAEQARRSGSFPQVFIALGALRLARQFDRAEEFLAGAASQVPAEWRGAWANERTALAWHRGRAEEAFGMWQTQADTVPVFFNRGMAALFSGQTREARDSLTAAVNELGEASSWHHLGKLYLTLAELRG